MTVKITLQGDIDLFRQFTNTSRFKSTLTSEVRKSGIRISLLLVRLVKNEIRRRAYDPNSTITQILKGGSTPLLGGLNLF